MQEITRRAALTSPADPPFIPPRMRPADPVMFLLNRFEGICEMIDLNVGARRAYEASDCLEPEEKPGVEAALERALKASHRRLNDAQIELFGMRATSYEGVLGKARYAWYLAADTAEKKASGPDRETTGRLDDKALLWSVLQDLEHLVGEG